MKNSKPVKLHLGCGKINFGKDWIHVDIVDFPHINIINSIDSLPMFENNSVDLIYSCHVLEHFHRKDTNRVLYEWFRILKSNGILRIAVPDFESVCKVYNRTKNIKNVIGLIFGRQNYLYNIHYNIFDFYSLKDILEKIGFENIGKYDWEKTEHAQIDDYSQAYYPHMDKENGILMSLNVEATKT